MTATPLLVLDHAAKRYGDFSLEVDLQVQPDTITALVGANGSGKTTAFRLALGLVRPDSGSAMLLGAPAFGAIPAVRRQVVATFEDGTQRAGITPNDLIAQYSVFYPDFDADGCRRLLERFALPAGKPLRSYSTGMHATCQVIMAICRRPRLLVLDEPTAGLDVVARERILDLLRAFMEGPGRSILVSSHDSRDIESLCDDFHYLKDGHVQLHETIGRLRDDYGVLLLDEAQMAALDDAYVLARQRVPGGWRVLTDQRAFYRENMPGIQIERGGVDALVSVMEQGMEQGVRR